MTQQTYILVIYIHKLNICSNKACTHMFLAALFLMVKKWKPSTSHLLMNGYTKYDIHTMVYYLAIKRNGILIHVIMYHRRYIRRYIEDKLWKHYSKWKKPDTKGNIVYNSMSKVGISIETETRWVIARAWGKGKMGVIRLILGVIKMGSIFGVIKMF